MNASGNRACGYHKSYRNLAVSSCESSRHQISSTGVYVIRFLCPIIWLIASSLFAGDQPPNIVIVLADDMGYGDLSAYNAESKISTPHLDRLARDGMLFTDAHSGGSTCVPSRYSLLTGRFSARMNRGSGPVIAEGHATIASLLRERGYRTNMVGKWHQRFDQDVRNKGKQADVVDYNQPLTGGPLDRGFDTFFGMHASLDIPPYFYIKDRSPLMAPTELVEDSSSVDGVEGWNKIQGAFWRNGRISPDFKHHEVTPRFAAEAVNVIQSHDGEKPLFLYLALPSPHTPWLPAKEFIGKSRAGMYGDFVMTVDSVVGRVLASLDSAGISDNTLVVFSSDNGPVWYEKDVQKFGHRSVGSLRGAKGSAWEGGHRMPFIVRWPGKVKAGTRSNHLVSFADVFATFGELTGLAKSSPSTAIDSVSFLPALLEPDTEHKPRPPILHSSKVIRDGDWKLIATKGSRGFTADRNQKFGTELYNLRDDLSETNNLADQMPHKVAHMEGEISQILTRSTTASATRDSGWRDLFNGKDLSGWEANVHPESFAVADGILRAHGKNGMSHLFFVGDTGRDVAFRNFELLAEVRSEPNSNSGIFFHTDRELRKGIYLNKGYEVQLNSTKKEKRKTGSLYAVVDLKKSPADESKWFTLRFKVQGKRIQVFVEGKQVVDYTEPPNPAREPSRAKRLIDSKGGALALQAHDPGSVFYFRRIRIRELD